MLRAITDPKECKGKTVKEVVFSQPQTRDGDNVVMAVFFDDDTYFCVRSYREFDFDTGEIDHVLKIQDETDLCRLNVEDFNKALGTHCKDFHEKSEWSNRFRSAGLWSKYRL